MTNLPNHQNEKSMRLNAAKRKETLFAQRSQPTKNTPTVIFCGSPYNLKLNRNAVIAVDLDGTLAELFTPYDPRRIGKPLPAMVTRVKQMLRQGKKVVILTARMNTKEHTPAQLAYTRKLISAWTKKYLGVALIATAEKHHLMTTIYDDRAVAVDSKTGRLK